MAEKRMLTMKICDSDAFLEMPLSTQCLYFHLNMRADDDGFIGNPKKIQRIIGSSEDDLRLLIMKKFLLVFDHGVIVIKHWKMHNTIQKDRYKPTSYQDELSQLEEKKDKSYTFTRANDQKMFPECIQNVSAGLGLGLDIDLEKDIVALPYQEIIEYLNQKAKKKFRVVDKTRKLIQARFNEKFTLEDFKKVIDNQTVKWLNDPKMADYLRPETLFGTKFEGYLNSNGVAPKQNVRVENVTEYPTIETDDVNEENLMKAFNSL